MEIIVLYADLSVWHGSPDRWSASPDDGVLRVSVIHPEHLSKRYELQFSGWDHYAVVQLRGNVQVSVWKTDDLDDPFYRKGMWWNLYPDGRQERYAYHDLDQLPVFDVERRGELVSDEIAREAGLL